MTGTVKYEAVIDLGERNNSHTMLHELALADGRPSLDILEVGCSSGYLGATLVARGHRVTGVEPDAPSAQAARERLTEVFAGGFDAFLDAHPDRDFDVVVFGDVLEHLVDPVDALQRARRHLRPGGSIVVSVPNVAHGSVRAMLLEGRWDYADKGILDHTHLRFFTRTGLAQLLADAGFALERLHAVSMPLDVAGHEYGMQLRRELVTAVELLDPDDSAPVFQYVLLARAGTAPAPALLASNLAVPCDRLAPAPHAPGSHSWRQRLQVKLFHHLLRQISRRRFRGR